MPVTKKLMAAGGWSLRLQDTTPHEVTDACHIASKAFGNIVILPSWADPRAITSGFLAHSIFTGPLYERADRLELGGHHAAAWLGDPNDIGPVISEGSGTVTGNFYGWITGYRPSYLSAGAVENINPTSTMGMDPVSMTSREVYDRALEWSRGDNANPFIEWEVSDSLTVNAGTVDYIFGTTPVAMLTPDWQGPDPTIYGLRATLSVTDDVQDYATRVFFAYSTGFPTWQSGAASPYKDPVGATLVRKVSHSAGEGDAAQVAKGAQGWIDRYDQFRRQVTVRTDAFAVMARMFCGSYVYCWDPDKDIYDTSVAAVPFRGRLTWPIKQRVVGMTMPIEQGMGVYLRAGNGTYTDLTRWVEWERPGATLELEHTDRRYAYDERL